MALSRSIAKGDSVENEAMIVTVAVDKDDETLLVGIEDATDGVVQLQWCCVGTKGLRMGGGREFVAS